MASVATVVVPVHDGERFLAGALRSIDDQALDLEVIVVDDGSTDASAAIADRLGVTCLRQEQAGPSAARNAGLAAATSDLVAFLDCDDEIPPGTLARQVDRLAAAPDVDVVMGMQRYEVVGGADLPDWAVTDRVGTSDEVARPLVFTGLFRRAVFDRVGVFDEELRLCEDVDWLMRANEAGVPVEVDETVARVRRIHGANLTYDTAGLRRAMFEVLGRRARRKQAAP